MTEEEAVRRGDRILRDTAEALEPRPVLELNERMSRSRRCLDPDDGGSEDRITVSRRYWLRGFPPERNGDVAAQVLRDWESKGYLIESSARLDTPEPEIYGFTVPEDFRISLDTAGDDSLYIGTTSPCIWPDGVDHG